MPASTRLAGGFAAERGVRRGRSWSGKGLDVAERNAAEAGRDAAGLRDGRNTSTRVAAAEGDAAPGYSPLAGGSPAGSPRRATAAARRQTRPVASEPPRRAAPRRRRRRDA